MRKLTKCVAASLVAALCVLVISPTPGAVAATPKQTSVSDQMAADLPGLSGPWEIWSRNAPSKCVEVAGGSSNSGAQVQIYRCGNPLPRHQRWYFQQVSGTDYWRIWDFMPDNVNSKCMNVAGGSLLSGKKIIQYDCTDATNEQFYLSQKPNTNFYQIVNRNSGLCLNVQGNSGLDGADLIQYPCDSNWGSDNMLFTWNTP